MQVGELHVYFCQFCAVIIVKHFIFMHCVSTKAELVNVNVNQSTMIDTKRTIVVRYSFVFLYFLLSPSLFNHCTFVFLLLMFITILRT